MLHKFSDEALEVVYRAEVFEQKTNFADLGAGSLLVGLMEQSTNIVSCELRDLELDLSKITAAVTIRRNNATCTDFEAFKSYFNEKIRIAQNTYLLTREFGHFLTFPEHIFLSILQKSIDAHTILEGLAVNGDSIREKVVTKLRADDRFKVPPGDDILQTTYLSKFVGLRWETKSLLVRESATDDIDESSLYNKTIQELRVADEEATTAKLRPRGT